MTDEIDGDVPDRYVSFVGLDCDRKAGHLTGAIREAMERAGREDPFWAYFHAKLEGGRGPAHDELYYLHSHLNDLRDMLERWEEYDLLGLLEDLETQCC